jgi:hypothetical protein
MKRKSGLRQSKKQRKTYKKEWPDNLQAAGHSGRVKPYSDMLATELCTNSPGNANERPPVQLYFQFT